MGLLRAADGSNTTVSQFAQKAVFICFYEHLGGRFPPPPPRKNKTPRAQWKRCVLQFQLVCLEYE